MHGMVWGEPELLHVWEFYHMVFFHSHNVKMLMRCEREVRNVNISYERRGGEIKMQLLHVHVRGGEEHRNLEGQYGSETSGAVNRCDKNVYFAPDAPLNSGVSEALRCC